MLKKSLFAFALIVLSGSALAESPFVKERHLFFQNTTPNQVEFTVTDEGAIQGGDAKAPPAHFIGQLDPLSPAPFMSTTWFWHHNIHVSARIVKSLDGNTDMSSMDCGPMNGNFSYVQEFHFKTEYAFDPIFRKHKMICITTHPII
ncbi:MAG: hypothetical protein K0S08_1867 [Gammaproteobacteria bacterium]|jgi:hypothetical protein|nr:hypothetical protein [Gammaproteobacteria bacterium]